MRNKKITKEFLEKLIEEELDEGWVVSKFNNERCFAVFTYEPSGEDFTIFWYDETINITATEMDYGTIKIIIDGVLGYFNWD